MFQRTQVLISSARVQRARSIAGTHAGRRARPPARGVPRVPAVNAVDRLICNSTSDYELVLIRMYYERTGGIMTRRPPIRPPPTPLPGALEVLLVLLLAYR